MGKNKLFARLLHERLVNLGLRSFLDEASLAIGDSASGTLEAHATEAAVKATQVAIVLLCEEFFQKEWPQRELRWFLRRHLAGRGKLVPVFLGVTHERCAELASKADLAAVCNVTGIRHAGERTRFMGKPVMHEETLDRIVQAVRNITGVARGVLTCDFRTCLCLLLKYADCGAYD